MTPNQVKINSLELENVKRVKAVSLEPSENGLTVIGGRNGQGKTSVLDAIAWALGGNRYKPSHAKREGSATDPHLKVELSNGIIVERKGANSNLKVVDPLGRKAGQTNLELPDIWKPAVQLMQADGVTLDEVRKVAADSGHFTMETPPENYPPEYITGFIVPEWPSILEVIKKNRIEVPF